MINLLQSWLDPQGAFNQLSVVWLGGWSTLALLMTISTALITLGLTWYNAARLTRGRRSTLLGLRALALLIFFILFLQPAARLEDVSRVKNHVVVLLDQSRSMSLPQQASSSAAVALGGVKSEVKSESRHETALRVLNRERATLQRWEPDHHITFFSFAGHLQDAQHLNALSQRTPQGAQTSLVSALNELSARYQPRELASIVLLSDGGDLSASGQVDPPPQLMAAAERLQAPLHTLALGPETPPLDFALAEVRADEFAFARNAVSVDVEVKVTGATGELWQRIALYRGSQLLSERVISVRVGETHYTARFEFVPEETGEEAYSVVIDPHSEERILENNTARFSMRVIRDKIRVLQVVGNPSWDQRFLRKHLKKNPNVELISFFILRTNSSIETARSSELSLIPFPTQELFEERLGSFDLMIFQDFTHLGYRMRRYLPLIRDYVKRGGGFVMVGGDQSFSGGGYAGTPLAEIIPLQLHPNSRDLVDLGAFTPTLSSTGMRHPITALSLAPDENEALWRSLPMLEGTNRVAGVKPDANVLAWRPPLKDGEARLPLIIASDSGEGRTLAITTDSMWRWAISPKSLSDDRGARSYHRFWGNAIRWLIRDPALNPLKVSADRDRYQVGAQTQLTATVRDASYQPAARTPITLIIEALADGGSATRQPEAREIYRAQGTSSERGEAIFTWRAPHAGAYRAKIISSAEGVTREARDLFVVSSGLVELRDTQPRPDLMRALSALSGGESLTLEQSWRDLKRTTPKVNQVNRREDVALWATWWALLLALFAPTLEWTLRRRWGLS